MALSTQALVLKPPCNGLINHEQLILAASRASIGLETKSNLEAARTLKKRIPPHNSTDVRDKYYGSLVQRAGTLEDSIDGAISNKEEAIMMMTLIFKNVESLYNLIDGYMRRSYQQRFNPEKFKSELQKIETAIENLQAIKSKSQTLVEELGKKFLEGDEFIQHSGQELQEDQLQKYLEISKNEKASQARWDDLTCRLREKSREIKDLEQRKLEAEQKAKELEERISSLKGLSQQRRAQIIEGKNELTVYEERREDLRTKANDTYAESVNKTAKDKEEQYNKVKASFNTRIDHIDEMLEELTKKFGSSSMMHTSYHFIFVLDKSGSMVGSKWEALMKALNLFVEKNKSQALDFQSVILFDHSAEEHMKKMRFSEYTPPVPSSWGGTNFDPAFTMTRDFANLSRSHCPVVIFLTDGDGAMHNTHALLREMSSAHKQKGFMLFSIGVGEEFNVEVLKEITKTANDGNLFIDLGNDRIELLYTAKREDVLDKIFTNISAAVYALPLKIKKAIDTLKQEKEEIGKEAEQTMEALNRFSEEELKDVDLKQQEILNRKMKTVEEKEIAHKERIQFLRKEVEEIEQEIHKLEKEIENENRAVTTTEIETLKQEQANLEAERVATYKEVEQFSEERKVALSEVQTKKTEMNISTTSKLFEFFKAKDNFEDANANTKTNLYRFKNFLGYIIEESSALKESLKEADFEATGLTDDGTFDIIVEFYKDSLELKLERGCDIPNMKKIACKILGIKDSHQEKNERLDLLFTCLHPRLLVNPNAKEDEHLNKIKNEVNKIAQYDIDLIGEQLKQCKTEKQKIEGGICKCKKDAERAQEDLEGSEKEIGKKEKEIRTLQKKMKAMGKEESKDVEIVDDKENKRRENIISDDSDDDDFMELLQKAKNAVKSLEKKRDDLETTISEFKCQKRRLEDNLYDVEKRIAEKDMKLSESERETKRLIQQLEQDYSSLRNELIPRIMKKVHDFRTEQLEIYKQNLAKSLLQPLKSYFSHIRNPMDVENKISNTIVPALDT